MYDQIPLIKDSIEEWDPNPIYSSLDELFHLAHRYKSSKEYQELLQFISSFRSYSIFNALLVYIQLPGAKYVAPASRWKRDYRRRIQFGAHPLVILKPMGPVMFVYDVKDTEPENNAPLLPDEVINPFKIKQGHIRNELKNTIENAKLHGVDVVLQDAGSVAAGSI